MKWRHAFLLFILAALFLLPQLFWGKLYMVGGDDSRLYYLFPKQYLENFSFKVIANNTLGGNMGYFPVSYSAPILAIATVVQYIFPWLHIQFFMYGIILMLGFLFMHLLLQELIPSFSVIGYISSIIAALYYVFSPFILKTFMQHQLIAIFMLMVLPGCLYFFVKGMKKRSYKYILLSSLFYSLCSATLLSIPWFLATVFIFMPLLIFVVFQYKDFLWKASIVLFISLFLLNFYWVIHHIIPIVYPTGEMSVASTNSTLQAKMANNDLIEALTHLNSPVYQIIGTVRTSWSDREGPTLAQSIGVIYLFVILLAGTRIHLVSSSLYKYYCVSLSGLLFAMLFFTPNFGEWNLHLFQFLNNYVPLFGMFRNTYDKFALAMAFHYSFVLYISLIVLEKTKTKTLFKYVGLLIVVGVMLFTAYPYLFPKFNDQEYSTRITGSLNKEFFQLTGFLKSNPTSSRYVWFPMTYPGYVYIKEDGVSNHYYSGLSPLQVLSGSSDIAGFYGIQTSVDPELNTKVAKLFKAKEFDAIGRILQKQNIGYVIVNNDTLPEKALIFLDAYSFMSNQNEEYKKFILGEKLKDFGARYSLYRINPKYDTNTVFLTTVIGEYPVPDNSIHFKKIRSGLFEISIPAITKSTKLVMMEPYNHLWKLQLLGKNTKINTRIENTMVYGFGNAWNIDPIALKVQYPGYVVKANDGSYSMRLQIQFMPDLITKPAVIVSIVSFIIVLILLCITR
ncbi:MAG: hypothetical protein UT26_C0001G0020 [Microgenomates group bacterium GW2011_GWC1_39_12]|nr:MAG: hypothetical protein UT26_C0001G0020 [Microgenomates group bacterium GW2011_GWC1_39_12]